MADVIARFKGDTSDLDNKVKKASQTLLQMKADCERVAGTFEVVEKEDLAFVKALGEMETQSKTTKGQLRELTQAATDLTQMYRGLTDAEKQSPFGVALLESIGKLTERAGQARDAMSDVRASIEAAASDTRVFDQLSGGMTVMTSAFQAGKGAAEMLGIEMEDSLVVMAKLQAAMAIANGLQQIQTNLQRQSALMQGVATMQQTALTAAKKLDTVATNGNVLATRAATVAQAALNAVAKANPYVLLSSAIAAVGSALWAFSKAASESEEEMERLTEESERAAQAAEAQRKSFVDAAAGASNTASRISYLATEYRRSNSELSKTEILSAAAEEFRKLGYQINSVSDAERMLVTHGSALVKSLTIQGEIAALSAMRIEAFKKSMANMMSNGYDVSGASVLAGANATVQDFDKRIAQLTAQNAAIMATLPKAGGGGHTSNGGGGGGHTSNGGGGGTKPTAHTKALNMDRMEGMGIDPELDDWLRRREINDAAMARMRQRQEMEDEKSGLGNRIQMFDLLGMGGLKFESSGRDFSKLRRQERSEANDTSLKKLDKSLGEVSKGLGGLNSIASGLKQMGVEVPKGMESLLGGLNGLMQIAQGISAILTILNTTILANTAATSANSATNIIPFWHGGAIRAAQGWGGVIGGASYVGDMVPIMANSGEMILNGGDVRKVYSMIHNSSTLAGGQGGLRLTADVRGSKLRLAINNDGKSRGRGVVIN